MPKHFHDLPPPAASLTYQSLAHSAETFTVGCEGICTEVRALELKKREESWSVYHSIILFCFECFFSTPFSDVWFIHVYTNTYKVFSSMCLRVSHPSVLPGDRDAPLSPILLERLRSADAVPLVHAAKVEPYS